MRVGLVPGFVIQGAARAWTHLDGSVATATGSWLLLAGILTVLALLDGLPLANILTCMHNPDCQDRGELMID